MNKQIYLKLLLALAVISGIIGSIHKTFAHHGGGTVGGGNSTISDSFELPIIIGLDGSLVFGYGGASVEYNESGLSPFQVTPILNLGLLFQDKKIQLNDGGFMRLRSNNSNIGFGGILTYASSYLFGTVAQVGLIRSKSKMVSMLQTSSDSSALDDLESLTIPKNLDELSSWSMGDQLSFSTSGSIIFAAGLGVWPMGANGQISASGTWLMNLTRKNQSTVRLLMRRDKSQSVGLSTGAIVLELGKNISNSFDQEFSYDFDLSNDSARKAYLKALTGDWVYVKKLWEQKTNGIKRVSVGNSHANSGNTVRRYGVPYFYRVNQSLANTSRNSSRSFFDEEVGYSTDNEKSVMVTINQVRTKIKKSRQVYKIQYVFNGGIDNHIHGDVNHKHPVASFKWFSERRYTTLMNFEYFLDMVADVSGFEALADIELPRVSPGYARISVDFNIKSKGFDKLFKIKNLRNYDLYLYQLIAQLKKTYEDQQDQKFRDIIKKMGHYLLNNPTALQEFARLVTRDGYSFKVKVEGEKFRPIELTI